MVAGLAAFGFQLEEGVELELEDEFCLWPDNLPAFDLWIGLQTQWQYDEGKRRGLDYAGVEASMRMDGLNKREREKYFPLIKSMEIAVLNDLSQRDR